MLCSPAGLCKPKSKAQAARRDTLGSILPSFYICRIQGGWRRLDAFFCNVSLFQNKSLSHSYWITHCHFWLAKALRGFPLNVAISTGQNLLFLSSLLQAKQLFQSPTTQAQEKGKKRIVSKGHKTSRKRQGLRLKALTTKVRDPEYFSLFARFWTQTLRLWSFLALQTLINTVPHGQTSLNNH